MCFQQSIPNITSHFKPPTSNLPFQTSHFKTSQYYLPFKISNLKTSHLKSTEWECAVNNVSQYYLPFIIQGGSNMKLQYISMYCSVSKVKKVSPVYGNHKSEIAFLMPLWWCPMHIPWPTNWPSVLSLMDHALGKSIIKTHSLTHILQEQIQKGSCLAGYIWYLCVQLFSTSAHKSVTQRRIS